MKPVLIVQHQPAQGPGYLLQCLQSREVPVCLMRRDLGDRFPLGMSSFSGLVVLGSDDSVLDDRPWMAAERALIADALRLDRPVLGHCFGAQQLARTLGATVTRQPRPDIGWRELWITPAARASFGGRDRLLSFNWHHDSFQIPAGARRTLFGSHCLNKGFAIGPHVGLQSHLEITEDSLRAWCGHGRDELAALRGMPTVQTEEEMLAALPERLARVRVAADRLYGAWIASLMRESAGGRRLGG